MQDVQHAADGRNPWGDIGNDLEAFERFRQAHGPRCRRLLDRMHGAVRDRFRIPRADYEAELDNAVEEAMAETRWRWSSYDPGRAAVATWVNAIACNRMRAALRMLVRHVKLFGGDGTPLAAEPAAPDRNLAAVEDRCSVQDTLERIDAGHARVLVLHYHERMSVRAIARRLGMTETAVQSRLQRGRGSFERAWNAGSGG